MVARTKIEDILFDRDEIISWLESKDPNERYDYAHFESCAFAQFLIEHGVNPIDFYRSHPETESCFPPGVWEDIVNGEPGTFGDGIVRYMGRSNTKNTYGEALERARKLLK